MYKTFDEQTLTRCPYCERTFSDTAYKHHQRACTADSPAKPAGTGLGKGSLAHKMVHLYNHNNTRSYYIIVKFLS